MKEILKDLSFLELFILNTVIYFDLFDYPLTLNEIHFNLYTGGMEGPAFTLEEIADCLQNSPKLKKIITTQCGFYFLQKRSSIIQTRLERYNLADKKFQIARRAVRFFKYVPFIKLVAVCNNLGYANAREESDIDLFVITAANRLWFVRFFLIAIIFVIGLRPSKAKAAKDKICLSYYVTTEHLNLEQTKIAEPDIHLIYWLSAFCQLYDRNDYFEQFYKANTWISKYLPNWQRPIYGYRRLINDNTFSRVIYKIKEYILQGKLGDFLNAWLKDLQLKHMNQKKKDLAVSKKNWVIINDDILKFHENDRRQAYLEAFEKKRKEIIDKI